MTPPTPAVLTAAELADGIVERFSRCARSSRLIALSLLAVS